MSSVLFLSSSCVSGPAECPGLKAYTLSIVTQDAGCHDSSYLGQILALMCRLKALEKSKSLVRFVFFVDRA
ncbi:hypothetical protein CB1_000513011, partial [Camelus ferus]